MRIDNFLPSSNASVIVAVTNAEQKVRLPVGVANAMASWRSGGEDVRIVHMGAAASPNVFFETSAAGDAKTASVTTSPVMMPGMQKVFRRAPGDDFISLIGDAAGPVNVCITVGNGI